MQLYGIRMYIAEVILVVLLTHALAKRCDRRPPNSLSPRSAVNGRYIIEIAGNPISYSPGKKYTITLRAVEQNEQNRFINFILLVESEAASKYNGNGYAQDVGNLQLLGDALTQFHDKCPNAVMETNAIPKSGIEVLWVAPPADSGCIAVRATIVLSREVWYSDDGPLSLILCENPHDGDDTQPPVLAECCACHEAKYEVTFEGLWSRNTHPKDFPPNNFMTRFSDIIGATHSVTYNFWEYNKLASDGLKELAEHGNTKALERELKDMSDHIRTIIKARGISYPNITGRTFAVFRVDERHHLMSLVSMIHPSPDWIVGVSSLELCQSNCSWVESKVLNLYPWDAGTDNGSTYLSEDTPNYPREPITKMTSKNPRESPFYDEQGTPMKPLARLILSRQRLYEKHTCTNAPNLPDPGPSEEYCAVTDWSDWSSCSTVCGKGTKHRQRTYKYKAPDRTKQHERCKQTLTHRGACYGAQHECRTDQPISGEECDLTPWGKLSECSVTCGNGTMTRSRRFKNHAAGKRCLQISSNLPLLEHNVPCTMPACENGEDPLLGIPSECIDRAWSDWSPCSVSCGKGVKTRKKQSINRDVLNKHNRISRSYRDEEEEEEEEEDGAEDICADVIERVECVNDQLETCDDSPTISDEYPTEPVGDPVNCEVSQWSDWSSCSVSCGRGTKMKTRLILSEALNGGKPCPKKMIKRKKCKVQCNPDETLDCVMTKWSSWSPCNVTCGPNAVRQRTRNISQHPKGGGRECPNRVEMENCNLPVCPEV